MGHRIKDCSPLKTKPMFKLNDRNKGQRSKDECLLLLGKVMRKLGQVSSPYFLLLSETVVAEFM